MPPFKILYMEHYSKLLFETRVLVLVKLVLLRLNTFDTRRFELRFEKSIKEVSLFFLLDIVLLGEKRFVTCMSVSPDIY